MKSCFLLPFDLSFCSEVDPYSIFMTPLTYEGLVDEVLHIENGRVKLDAALLGEAKEVRRSPTIHSLLR
jgi:hypothetical protein